MSQLKIENHQLVGPDVQQMACPKNAVKFKSSLPDTVIIHYTAGSDALSSANFLCQPKVEASAHVVISRDGKIYQLVPFDTIAWHAGHSQFGSRTAYNQYSIGIELDNAGQLQPVGTEYQAWFGKKYLPSEVMKAIHRNQTEPAFWHVYTQEQIDTCQRLCELLKETYGILYIMGHEEISPGRKTDPGPAFPLDPMRAQVLSANRKDQEPFVAKAGKVINANVLNIRESPSMNAAKVANPLPQGTEVTIIDEANGWYRVETKITGWVSKSYIESKDL